MMNKVITFLTMLMPFFINIYLIVITSFDVAEEVKANNNKNFDIINIKVIALIIIDALLIAIFLYIIFYLIFMGMP